MMKQKYHRRRDANEEASDVGSEKSKSKSEHRIPRLLLDDALIMVRFSIDIHRSLQT